jgi:hypothetical protein
VRPGSEISKFMCELYTNFGSFTAWRKKGFYFWAPQLVALYFANKGHHVDGMPRMDDGLPASSRCASALALDDALQDPLAR